MSKIKTYTLADIPPEFKVRNDLISGAKIQMFRGMLAFAIEYKSGKQGVGGGYNSTSNIGFIIKNLAELVGANEEHYPDLLKSLVGTPIRVAFKSEAGGNCVESTYIGHFMKDEFIYYPDLIRCGL